MHVITRRRLLEFAQQHSDCGGALDSWYRIMPHGHFVDLQDLRRTLPSADRVGRFTVFNIGGNKARSIAAIHYNRGKVYVRHFVWKN